jgi:hypothetical protein
MTLDEYSLNTWSAAYIEQAQTNIKEFPPPSPTKCGVSNDIMSLLALYAVTAKDKDTVKELWARRLFVPPSSRPRCFLTG